jgi:geranylgeranyl diphosphate synthase type I
MAVAVRQIVTAHSPPAGGAAGEIPLPLQRQLPALTAALRASALPRHTRLGTMSAYHLGWTDADGMLTASGGGKFLRGCLALWAAQRCGRRPGDALAAAVAVEWIHNFTLVHDDVQDGDRERRHRPTVWVVWGSPQAINAGDGMHAVAYRALLSARGRPQTRVRAAAAINNAVLAVIEGQCLDLALEGQVDTTVATYIRLARAKTGALIGAALEAGAIMSGATAGEAACLRRAGIELGIAFQIRDDWLGTWGDTSVTGKSSGDLARRKLTYPVVLGLSLLGGAARREFRRLYSLPGGSEESILALLDDVDAAGAVDDELVRRSRAAIRQVQRCGLPDVAVEEFQSIVDFVGRRVA